MNWIIWLPFVALLALAPVAIKRARRQQRALVEALGQARPHYHKVGILGLSVPVQSTMKFLLLHENDETRQARIRGELIEPQTGIGAFDARYFLESDDPELAPWLASDEPARQLIEGLLEHGRALELVSGKLTLQGKWQPTELDLLHQVSTRLTNLAARVPRLTAVHPSAAAQDRVVSQLRWIFSTVSIAAGALTLYSLFEPTFPQNAVRWPLWLGGAVVGGLLAWPACRWADMRARSSARARSLRQEAFGGLALPLILIGALAAPQLNLHVGGSPVILEAATISGKLSQRKGRRYVAIASKTGLPHQLWRCSQALHQRAERGQTVSIRWRHGVFGVAVLLAEPTLPLPSVPAR